jgi:hypothetical protein
MDRQQSPFPCHWWGVGLEVAGLADERPDVGTYGRYAFESLPRLPFPMNKDFAWLRRASPHRQSIAVEKRDRNTLALPALVDACRLLGISLPTEFSAFMQEAALQERIRSSTDCFLDLCTAPVVSPVGDGYLIRFLADSQGCVYWYLFLNRDGSDYAVVSSVGFYGTADESWQDDEPDPADIVFSAESFEVFMARFWIENEIWHAASDGTPMPEGGDQYVAGYRRKT